MPILEIESLHKTFRQGFWGRRNVVLKDLTFAVEEGEVYGFLGHNGAGKSTTIKLILGLIRANSGRISVFDSGAVTKRDRTRIGYLSEEIGLYPHLDAADMLRLVGELFRLRGAELTRRIDYLLESVGLEPHRSLKIKHFSKGMHQRLGIAAALINDPDLLVLDEPYSGLDPVGRKQFRELLLSFKAQGKTILLSSHIVPDVEAVCDRVGILGGGKITRCLDLNEVHTGESEEVEVTVSGLDPSRFASSDVRDFQPVLTNGGLTVLRCKGADKLKSLVTDVYQTNGTVVELRPLKMNLEDVFVQELTNQLDDKTAEETKKADEMAFTK